MKNFWHEHSLSILAIAILSTWIIASQFTDDQSHWGAFFNNAIADWSGVVAVVLATKYLYEKNSRESNEPPAEPLDEPRWKQLIIEHSLSLFWSHGTGDIDSLYQSGHTHEGWRNYGQYPV